jgi:hypothetical protein
MRAGHNRAREPATFTIELDAIALQLLAANGCALVMVRERHVAILVRLTANIDLRVTPPARNVIEIELRGSIT